MSGGLLKWRVAFTCTFLNFTILSQMRIVGLQYVATLERYDVSRSQAMFPYVLRYIIAFVCGPFIGFFGCKFGLKPVTLSGCCLVSFGTGLCFFAEDVIVITIGFGLFTGLGSGMARHLLPSYMNLHFAPEDLARVNGLAMAGASLGGFVYPPLFEYLLEEFGISGAFLLLAACSLHNIPAAMMLSTRPSRTAKNSSMNCKTSVEKFDSFTATRSCTKAETVHLVCNDNVRVTGEMEDNNRVDKSLEITESEEQHEENEYSVKNPRAPLSTIYSAEGHTDLRSNQSDKDHATERWLDNPNEHIATSSFAGEDLNFQSKHPEKDETTEKLLNSDAIDFQPVAVRQPSRLPCPQKPSVFESLRVLYSPTFILMTIIQSSFMCIVALHGTVLVDFAKDKGVTTDQSVHMLMWSAVADLVGCLTLGWVTDKSWLSATQFSALCYFCFGLCTTAFALTSNFLGLVISAALTSFLAGGQMLTFPVLISQYFEGEKRNIALTSRFVLVCPMSFAAAPFVGQVRDGIGSYEWVFYFMHIFSIFASALILLMPFVARRRK